MPVPLIPSSKKAKSCKVRNCTPVVYNAYGEENTASDWCLGYRTGVITEKRKGIKNVPSDVFVSCICIGGHSEATGIHRFIYNIADFYLDLRKMFMATDRFGLLKRTFRSVLVHVSEDVVNDLEAEIKRYRKRQKHSSPIQEGTKFIEFSCSCGEVFLREYNDEHKGNYYKPDDKDKTLFWIHKQLGHTIYYKKCKRVKRSRVGDNKYWQQWGPYEYDG